MPLLQRKRPAEPEPEDSPEPSPEPASQRRRTLVEDEDDAAYGGGAETPPDANLDQMVKKMVRLALACEYQRRPIRRADIGEKVLGTAGRKFKEVFNRAQTELAHVFGMEMLESPVREKFTLAQKRAAQRQSQQTKVTTSWILVSVLPSPFHNPEILPPPAVPTSTEESKYVAIYTTLISLISLSGGTLPEAKMDRYLRRLNMEDNTPVNEYEKTEKLFKRLDRDGYVLKIKESTGTGEDDIYWVVGPRGKVEVGNNGVEGMVRAVYGDMNDDEEDELARKITRSLGIGENPSENQGRERQKSVRNTQKRGRKKRDAVEEGDSEDVESEEEEEEEGADA